MTAGRRSRSSTRRSAALALVDRRRERHASRTRRKPGQQHGVRQELRRHGPGFDLVDSEIVDLPDPVAIRGSKLTYTVIAVNGGTEDSANNGQVVSIRRAGDGVTFLSAAGSNGFNCGVPNGSGRSRATAICRPAATRR